MKTIDVYPEDANDESFEVRCDGEFADDSATQAEAVKKATMYAEANGIDSITVWIKPRH